MNSQPPFLPLVRQKLPLRVTSLTLLTPRPLKKLQPHFAMRPVFQFSGPDDVVRSHDFARRGSPDPAETDDRRSPLLAFIDYDLAVVHALIKH
jgi:hypothetical protein